MTITYRCRACGAWLETSNEQQSGLCGACDGLRQVRETVEEALSSPHAQAAVLALIPGGYDPRKTGHGPDVVYLMADEGHLTEQGLAALMRLMHSGADAYAYYAISGKPCVYAYGRRWAAREWNAAASAVAQVAESEVR
jgi:hypothetical protein